MDFYFRDKALSDVSAHQETKEIPPLSLFTREKKPV